MRNLSAVSPEDEWSSIPLRDAVSKLKDGTHYSPQSKTGSYMYLTSKNIKFGRIDLSDVGYISEEEHRQIFAGSPVEFGDVLMTKDGANTGNAALNDLDEEFSLLSSVAIISGKINILTNHYLKQLLLSPHMQRLIKSEMAGQAITRLTLTQIGSFVLRLPPVDEQEGIAAILHSWDKAISIAEQLEENSRIQKQSLIQQLLTGKRRLPEFANTENWQDTKYGDIPADWGFLQIAGVADEVSERNESNEYRTVLSCSKHEGFVNSLEYFKKKVYSDDTSNYKVIRNGDFGFPSNHIEEGSIGYQNLCDLGIVSPIYTIFRTNEAMHDGYLYKLLKTEHYRQIFAANTNASVDRRGSLRWKEFSKIRVPVPSYDEQAAISALIDQAEAVRANYEDQKTTLVNQKKALMQQLLTGKRRIKVDKGTA